MKNVSALNSALSNGGKPMDIREVRRLRMEELAEEFGTLEEVGKRAGLGANWLSQIRGGRGMGHKTARRLEEGCRKPRGWMDIPPGMPDKILEKWLRLTDSQRKAVEAVIDSYLSE